MEVQADTDHHHRWIGHVLSEHARNLAGNRRGLDHQVVRPLEAEGCAMGGRSPPCCGRDGPSDQPRLDSGRWEPETDHQLAAAVILPPAIEASSTSGLMISDAHSRRTVARPSRLGEIRVGRTRRRNMTEREPQLAGERSGEREGARGRRRVHRLTVALGSSPTMPRLRPFAGHRKGPLMADSLYNRLGGAPAIEAAVDAFYDKIVADPQLAPFFKPVNMKAQRNQQVKFLTAAFGGPDQYRGRDMAEAHSKLNITAADFDAVAGHLVATLQELGVPADLIDEVVAIAGPLKDVIVNVHTV